MSDMTKWGAVYAFFLLFKRLYLSAVMEFTDGPVNATMSLVIQTVDTAFVCLLRPYNDGQLSVTEAVAALSNLASYVCLGLPSFIGQGAFLGEIPVMILMSLGVIVSAITSALQGFVDLVLGIHSACLFLAGLVGGASLAGEAGELAAFADEAGAVDDATGEARGVVADGLQEAAEVGERGSSEDEEELGVDDQGVLAASGAGLAIAAGRRYSSNVLYVAGLANFVHLADLLPYNAVLHEPCRARGQLMMVTGRPQERTLRQATTD